MSFRLDRFLTLYFFGLLARLRKPRGLRLPILMYHSISDDPETGHPYYWINTSPALFAQHMQYLHDNGYQVISLSTAVEMVKNQTYYPGKPRDLSHTEITEVTEKSKTLSHAHSAAGAASFEAAEAQRKDLTKRENDIFLPGMVERTIPGNPRSLQDATLPASLQDASLQPEVVSKSSNTSASFSSVTSVGSSEHASPANGCETMSSRFVVLTFDDGYADFYTHAFPALKQHGFTAIVFLPTDYIGNGKPGLRGKQHLTWDQVRELLAQGITFGSHTCSHPQLYDSGKEEIEAELRKSKETIEAHLNESTNPLINQSPGSCCLQSTASCCPQSTSQRANLSTGFDSPVNVDSFCYPFRFPEQNSGFVEGFNETLQRVGYETCASTRIGTVNTAKDMLALKRIPVNSGDDAALFAAKLRGGYDWLQAFQAAAKRVRRSA